MEKAQSTEEVCSSEINIEAGQENNPQSTSSLQAEKRNVLIDFTERTTLHGIRYIVEEGCIFRR